MAQVQVQAQKNQSDAQLKGQELQIRQQEMAVKHADNLAKQAAQKARLEAKVAETHMKTLAEIGHAMIQGQAQREAMFSGQNHEHNKALMGNFHDLLKSKLDSDTKMAMQANDHAMRATSQLADQQHQANQQQSAQDAAAA
jgi:hypothetical protein